MKITYTLQDWINERNAALEDRLESAREIYHAITENRADAYPPAEPKTLLMSTPSPMSEHERRWCEAQVKFFRWW